MHKNEVPGFIFGVLAAFFYSIMATLVKLAEPVQNETIVFFRTALCFVFILPIVIVRKSPLKTKQVKLHLVRAVAGIGALYCYFYAVKHLHLLNAILLANTIPLFIPLVVLIWLRLKIPKRRVFAIIIGFLGVVLILRPDVSFFNNVASFSGLAAGLLGATALVGVRQLTKTEPPERILFYFFLFGTVVSFLPMIITWKPILDWKMWVYIFLIGVAGILFQYFLTKAYSYMPATKASSLMYLSVIFGGISGWLIWDSVPILWTLFGILLVFFGGLMALLDKKQPVRMGIKPRKKL